ncbi:hypothetical protein JXB41_09145 [Candidatus Woesearchaeota archaeon]|nr:hypothetical protein [Candidatus Woesearchaeota archaeon]
MITKNNLIEWLKKIDKKVNKKITLIAVGGTAMTLLGLKSSTRDVDFCIESKDANIFKKHIKSDLFKVDLFYEGFIFSEQLPEDYINKSNQLKIGLKNIDLRTLSLIDIIITKAARYNERDEEDIAAIAKLKKINKNELLKRFNQIIDTYAGRKQDFEYQFALIVRRHFS